MSDFTAKIHRIQFPLDCAPDSAGGLTALPRPPYLNLGEGEGLRERDCDCMGKGGKWGRQWAVKGGEWGKELGAEGQMEGLREKGWRGGRGEGRGVGVGRGREEMGKSKDEL